MTVGDLGAHGLLLDELRSLSVGPPSVAFQKPQLPGKFLDRWAPVLLGAWRTQLVRSAIVASAGLGLLLVAPLASRSAWAAAGGLGLLAWSLVGVSGGVPFLEVETRAGFYGAVAGGTPGAARNAKLARAFGAWFARFRGTPWIRSGELCTMCPYFWNPNRSAKLVYERVWLEMEDKERVATDWVFPPGGCDPERPVVILLTGLAPDVHWTKTGGFVADAVQHLTTKLGMTAIVLVARGTMDTEVQEHLFHGAHLTDLRDVVLLVEKAMKVASASPPMIFGAGYSMGAIILANYCGVYGADARLSGVVHFSGIYDAEHNIKFEYSLQTWQAYLAYGLKTSFFSERTLQESMKRGVDIRKIFSRSTANVLDIDRTFVSVYNGYADVLDYYWDMSLAAFGKWKNVRVPVLAIAARDDPITHCDGLRAEEFSSQNENLLFFITDRGGHVGWPWGLRPWARGFDFMNEAIGVFVDSVVESERRS